MAYDSRNLDDYVDVAQRIADFREQYPEGFLRPLDPAEPYRIVQVQGWDKDGSVAQQTFIVVVAAAWKHPLDELPGVGMAWEVFPGRTPYTRGSELMNAETSAWGRAIIAALASDSKRGVSSREEVRNRQAERDEPAAAPGRVRTAHSDPEHVRLRRGLPGEAAGAEGRVEGTVRTAGPVPEDENIWQGPPAEGEDAPGSRSDAQNRQLFALLAQVGVSKPSEQRELVAGVIGRQIGSRSDLSYREAGDVIAWLQREAAKREGAGDEPAV